METDVQPVESSTAAFTVPTDPNEYAKWRATGDTPEAPARPEKKTPKPEAAASSTKHSDRASDEQADNTAPAPEAGTPTQGKKRDTAQDRLNELLADLRNAGYTPAELKTLKREAQAQAKEQPKAAPESTEKPAVTYGPPKRPAMKDFTGTFEEYEAALAKYEDELTDYKVAKAIEADRSKQAQEAVNRELNTRLDKAKERYGEEAAPAIVSAAKTINGDAAISPVVKQMLYESGAAVVDVVYALSSDHASFEVFLNEARTNPGAAIRRIVLVEKLVKEELAGASTTAKSGEDAGGAERDPETGKFTAQPPAKQRPTAPPPPREASGRQAAPPDPSDAAAASGNFRGFMASENAKDLARRQGR